MDNILKNLNQAQKQAVTDVVGPLLIVAGAGTGKTTVITRRIAYLLEQKKATAEQILALTFTDKAALGMEERVEELLPIGFADLWVSTFHSFGERILKAHALDIGISNSFELLNSIQQATLIRQNLDKFELDYYKPLGNPTKFVSALISHFSRLKDEAISPQEYLEYAEEINADLDQKFAKAKSREMTAEEKANADEAQRILELANAYHIYNQLLLEKNALDFGDLIFYTLQLFQKRPAILRQYQKQFKYILVDEFQDTNFAQYALVKILALPENNLCVCGDDDQAIYKFRGASISNILEFKKDFKQAREIVLTQNYRSGQKILDLAYDFIQLNNPNRLEVALKDKISKKLKSEHKSPGQFQVIFAKSVDQEAKQVVEKIMGLKEKDPKLLWSENVILIRANDQAEIFMSYLDKTGIPYQFLASKGLLTKPLIVDLISFLRLLADYHESKAMYRLLSMEIFKISNADLIYLLNYSSRYNKSLYETLQLINTIKEVSDLGRKKIIQVTQLFEAISVEAKSKPVGEVLFAFIENSGLLKILTQDIADLKNTENILYLNSFFKFIEQIQGRSADHSVKTVLAELENLLQAGETGDLQNMFEEGPETVKIMTIHGAKGLEFKNVFLVGLVDKRFPTIERKEPLQIPDAIVKEILPEGDVHLQEERRLMYVALTRAKENLFLSYARDYGGKTKKKPSRFLIELGLVKEEKKIKKNIKVEPDFLPPPKNKFKATSLELQHLPKSFSFSQLMAYDTCPYQYRYSFVLRVPSRGRHTFSYGKTMHNTLDRFFEELLNQKKAVQSDLFAQSGSAKPKKSLTLENLLKIYEEEWIGEWYDSKQHEAEYKKQGKNSLKDFFAKYENNWPDILFLEKDFNFKLEEIIVKGKIDRVDQLGDGRVSIVDYKTGSMPASKNKVKAEQLYIYALAALDVLKLQPATLVFYYLNNNQNIELAINDKKLATTKKWVVEIARNIKAGDFTPIPQKFKCDFCDFKGICPYRTP